ncbi:MAG: lysylphosphatidylglycerol synthase transmembrane domain-containing protein [Planctomycetota bacterium]|jgi:uncharacterized protein (TIRG00374 family)
MAKRGNKRLFDILRILICIGALWLVIQGVSFRDHVTLADGAGSLQGSVIEQGETVVIELTSGERRSIPITSIATDEDGAPLISLGLRSAWQRSNKALILLAIAIHMPVVLLQAIRLRWLLAAQAISLGYWESVKLSLAGNFLNFATPLGSNAGDVFKAYFVALHTDKKTEAATTVLLDRLVGLGSLLLVVAAITTFSSSDGRLAQFRPYILGFVGVGIVSGLLYLSPWIRRHLVPTSLLSRLPMAHHLRRIDTATRTLAAHRWTLAGSFLITISLQGMAMTAYFTVAVALGVDANLGNILEFFSYFYVGCVIQALPGPPQGLGTVELAYRYFFSAYGTASQIVCMAFVIRVVVLACALPGLLVTLTGGYKPAASKSWRDNLDASDSNDRKTEAEPA